MYKKYVNKMNKPNLFEKREEMINSEEKSK